MNFADFNQDASCLAIGTNRGYRLFNCSPFGRFFAADDGACGCVAMLFATALVALAGQGEQAHRSPRRLRVVNTKRDRVLCELTFPTSVLAIKMNRKRLVVVLEAQIYIYNIANMKLLHTIETPPNPDYVADLSRGGETNYLVYPAGPPAKHHTVEPTVAGSGLGSPSGELAVFDCDTLAPVNVIRAHRSPLALVVLNADGSLAATTSDKGTLIRVFSIPSGTILHQFRRGTYHSRVWSLAFNLSSTLLGVASATGTVHIYKLSRGDTGSGASQSGTDNALDISESPQSQTQPQSSSPTGEPGQDLEPPPKPVKPKSGWGLRRKVKSALPRPPAAVQDMWESSRSRDFAWFRLPVKPGARSVLGFAPLSNIVYVATSMGQLFHYQIDVERGGECERVAEYSLLD